jgi:hypothetical protein
MSKRQEEKKRMQVKRKEKSRSIRKKEKDHGYVAASI